jgi:multiple sugar transport system ATP-binding protein
MGMRLPGPRGQGALTLGIRAEDLTPADEGLQCKVAVIDPLGAHILATALPGHGVFRAALPNDTPLDCGQTLRLRPDLARVRWYDDQGRLLNQWK